MTREEVWIRAACTALSGKYTSTSSIGCADEILKAYDERFKQPSECAKRVEGFKKCPKCLGYGYIESPGGFAGRVCDYCHGKGSIRFTRLMPM